MSKDRHLFYGFAAIKAVEESEYANISDNEGDHAGFALIEFDPYHLKGFRTKLRVPYDQYVKEMARVLDLPREQRVREGKAPEVSSFLSTLSAHSLALVGSHLVMRTTGNRDFPGVSSRLDVARREAVSWAESHPSAPIAAIGVQIERVIAARDEISLLEACEALGEDPSDLHQAEIVRIMDGDVNVVPHAIPLLYPCEYGDLPEVQRWMAREGFELVSLTDEYDVGVQQPLEGDEALTDGAVKMCADDAQKFAQKRLTEGAPMDAGFWDDFRQVHSFRVANTAGTLVGAASHGIRVLEIFRGFDEE